MALMAFCDGFLEPRPVFSAIRFPALCASSNTITPSKSFPNQSAIISALVSPPFFPLFKVSYDTNMMPLSNLPMPPFLPFSFEKSIISLSLPPRSTQSRLASFTRPDDTETHTAFVLPLLKLSRIIPEISLPLPTPVPSPIRNPFLFPFGRTVSCACPAYMTASSCASDKTPLVIISRSRFGT